MCCWGGGVFFLTKKMLGEKNCISVSCIHPNVCMYVGYSSRVTSMLSSSAILPFSARYDRCLVSLNFEDKTFVVQKFHVAN